MSDQPRLFTADFYRGNRQNVIATSQARLIVVPAHAEVQSSADIAFRFRQDSSFRYLTGIGYPELLLVIDVERGEEYLIGPKTVDAIYDVFNGALDPEAARQQSGIANIYSWREGWPKLVERARAIGQVHTLLPPPRYITFYKMFSNPARAQFANRLKRAVPGVTFADLRPTMATLRQIKQASEIQAIQKAIDITAEAFAETYKQRATLEHEYNVQARLEFEFRNRGAVGKGYETIVAGGKHACTLHYVENNDPLRHNELLLIDAGADYEHYSADISRTFARTQATPRQQAVIQAVYEVQQAMYEHFKPGADRSQIEQIAETKIGAALKQLKLITVANRANIRHYFPHALGHFLGIDVHDIGDYSAPLQPGMVMTVEPGIYIPEEGIGVRIEDNIVITDTGCTILSEAIPSYVD